MIIAASTGALIALAVVLVLLAVVFFVVLGKARRP
jgi:hypothetical protein